MQYLRDQINKNPDYVAMCDIAEKISCSSVISSEYSKFFSFIGLVPEGSVLDVSTAIYGAAFYAALLILNVLSDAKRVILAAAVIANIISVILVYIMIFILQDLCVVCMCTHACNFTILMITVLDICSGETMPKQPQKENKLA